MKKNVKLFGRTVLMLLAISACEKDNLDEDPIPVPDSKLLYNEMIKSYNNEMVLKWDNAISLAIDNLSPPPPESRAYAMVTLAMHDALNNVVPKYETYALDNSAVDLEDVSKKVVSQIADAAVSQAAHDVLVIVAPDKKTDADDLLVECLSKIENSGFKEDGIRIGKEAAAAILEKRAKDLKPMFDTSDQGTLPGDYRSYMPWAVPNFPIWPENAVYAPAWGTVETFGITTGKQFRPGPPYPINSPEYASDYKEVLSMGCNECPNRTQEQLDMGAFFIENSPSAMNRIAKSFAVKEKLNGFKTARLLALTHMVLADTHISIFDAKYFYNSWRPITAVRQGDNDGNDNTAGDPNWMIPQRPEIRPTPPTPAYPSSHAANGRAAAELFKLFFGKDKKLFTVESISLPGTKRNYTSFSQLASEISLSRIYIGYHFRQDIIEGEKMGRQLAEFVYHNNLRELK
ncbi:phosphatase PAP2 family protein [Arenibacter sp. BSSL-BM3]|uniref:Phosphatase PAP2 family protein n=1 Tax=Arenibacter arenosicollis TaxID=2762274 RepID=A0ABR7QKM4_9FLAO|nr:vanadium-dependent haloperoxidase [Arenibacter arenosicollis]MBC8767741.1 phosphatase PAP2 family protein [Arenibacter arenosicollis]